MLDLSYSDVQEVKRNELDVLKSGFMFLHVKSSKLVYVPISEQLQKCLIKPEIFLMINSNLHAFLPPTYHIVQHDLKANGVKFSSFWFFCK